MQVKSTVPFSEPYVIDPQNPPPDKDYDEYFKNLKDGVTGKEALEGTPVPVWCYNCSCCCSREWFVLNYSYSFHLQISIV